MSLDRDPFHAPSPAGPVQHLCDLCGAFAHSGFGLPRDDLAMWACAAHAPEIEARYFAARTERARKAQLAMQPAQGKLL